MNLIHVSDTHGKLPQLPSAAKLVVHSGDMLAGEHYGAMYNSVLQEDWLRRRISKFARWLDGRRFLFCAGNHDFFDPIPMMQSAGIDAVNITGVAHEEDGVRFYGFPFIPWFCGKWNYEVSDAFAESALSGVEDVDVMVAHAPPFGVRDSIQWEGNTIQIGSKPLRSWVENAWPRPRLILCGHAHEGKGMEYLADALVVNSATTVHEVSLSTREEEWSVLVAQRVQARTELAQGKKSDV